MPTLIMRFLLAANVVAAFTAGRELESAQGVARVTELPARFTADRIFVNLVTRRGDTLDLYTDTGGGLFVTRAAAGRIG